MAKPKTSRTAVERRAEELDTIAAVLTLDRRDELAELLTDEDIETLRHLVHQGMGDNPSRAKTTSSQERQGDYRRCPGQAARHLRDRQPAGHPDGGLCLRRPPP